MTPKQMIYEIDRVCKKYSVRVRYYEYGPGGTWGLTVDQFAELFTPGSDINIQGLAARGVNGNWGTRYSLNE